MEKGMNRTIQCVVLLLTLLGAVALLAQSDNKSNAGDDAKVAG